MARLIIGGQIAARIDSANHLLYARHADQRSHTYASAIATGEAYLRETRSLLLRGSLLQHDLVQACCILYFGGMMMLQNIP